MKHACLVAAFVLLLFSMAAAADAPMESDEEYWGRPVVVTATRSAQDLTNVAANVTVLTEAEIGRSASLAVDDLLRQIPGFTTLRQTSSLVGSPTGQALSLRGVGADLAFPDGSEWDINLFATVQSYDNYSSRSSKDGLTEDPSTSQYDVPSSSAGSNVQWSKTFGGAHQIVTGADYQRIEAESDEWADYSKGIFATGLEVGGLQQLAGAYVQEIYSPSLYWRVIASARLDYMHNSDGFYRTMDLTTGETTVDDVFDEATETSVNPSLGVVYGLGRRFLGRVTGFWNEVENTITQRTLGVVGNRRAGHAAPRPRRRPDPHLIEEGSTPGFGAPARRGDPRKQNAIPGAVRTIAAIEYPHATPGGPHRSPARIPAAVPALKTISQTSCRDARPSDTYAQWFPMPRRVANATGERMRTSGIARLHWSPRMRSTMFSASTAR